MKALLITAGLLLSGATASFAQTAPAYEFMTVLESESQMGGQAKIIFAPAFQGKSEMPLEELPGGVSNKYHTVLRKNMEVVNQQLSGITVAGWELVHVSTDRMGTQYLFRKAKH
ncbi:hypothetical protein [Hymenobacter sp. CRA2]|uniref:hypothetical protein n=1 Tax=Hymenobacter sp. CRA2 TaxID=1955620 RepID=UPI0011165DB7|nr:hypothetical protein [Hymenobacter sp. CRA2]